MTTELEKMPERIFVHEVTDYWHNGMIKYSYQCDENWNGSQHEYVRADLCVPLADVMELVSLIDCLIQNNPDDSISDSGHTVLQLWRHDAQKALANFKQKYGEDIAKS